MKFKKKNHERNSGKNIRNSRNKFKKQETNLKRKKDLKKERNLPKK